MMAHSMMTFEECMSAILRDPEDDAPRRALATVVRASDPQWAEFIELQLDLALERRRLLKTHSNDHREGVLASKNRRRWSRDLDQYMGELGIHRHVGLDRGLVFSCSMNPYAFLEHGEHIVSNIAPLRGLRFFNDPKRPFPMKEIAASPLLARFDSLQFHDCTLTEAELLTFAGSTHLDRCQFLTFPRGGSPEVSDTLAANPQTRACLEISTGEWNWPTRGGEPGPIGEFTVSNEHGGYESFEMSAQGRELEQKYGYIPWLHMHNICNSVDVHYFVERKELPIFVPGSPADAPIVNANAKDRDIDRRNTESLAPRWAAARYFQNGSW